jgi:hypothetical protein
MFSVPAAADQVRLPPHLHTQFGISLHRLVDRKRGAEKWVHLAAAEGVQDNVIVQSLVRADSANVELRLLRRSGRLVTTSKKYKPSTFS